MRLVHARATAIGVSVLALVATLALITFQLTGGQAHVATAEEFLQQIPNRLPVDEGDVIHTTTERWNRYGDKASTISGVPGMSTERTFEDTWLKVGPNDTVVGQLTRLTDANGIVIQEATISRQGSRTVDPRTGAVLATSARTSAALNGQAERSERFLRGIQDGSLNVIFQDNESLVLEARLPSDAISTKTGNGWTVPYIADLNAVELIQTITLDRNGTVRSETTDVVTQSGEQTRVATVVGTFEVVDEAPRGTFS